MGKINLDFQQQITDFGNRPYKRGRNFNLRSDNIVYLVHINLVILENNDTLGRGEGGIDITS